MIITLFSLQFLNKFLYQKIFKRKGQKGLQVELFFLKLNLIVRNQWDLWTFRQIIFSKELGKQKIAGKLTKTYKILILTTQ